MQNYSVLFHNGKSSNSYRTQFNFPTDKNWPTLRNKINFFRNVNV